MAEVVGWYAAGVKLKDFVCDCGWRGRIADMSQEPFHDLVEYSCPTCDTSLMIRPFPTMDEVRVAAASGDPEVTKDLATMEQAGAEN